MHRIIRPARVTLFIVLLFVVAAIYAVAIYDLQIISGDEYLAESKNTIVTSATVSASRGAITDRYGRALVYNRACYNITINRSVFLAGSPCDTALALAETALNYNVEYTDTFPVTQPPFRYAENMTGDQTARLERYLDYFDLAPDSSAEELLAFMRRHYGMAEDVSDSDARLICGVRYEVELRAIADIPAYVFASDVSEDFIAAILERALLGVTVQTGSVRDYNTRYAAQLLGYTGLMGSSEVEKYTALGYPMDAVVGKDGAERAFESYLHGANGTLTTISTSTGAVTETYYKKEPEPGGDVALTIDLALQEAAELSLQSRIDEINRGRTEEGQEQAAGGAVVAIQVGTGEVLAMASYPSYDPATMRADFTALSADERNPMLNRATQGTYSPGSTFKIVTAVSALSNNVIGVGTEIYDAGKFTEYDSYQPQCWLYPYGSHGYLNVAGAIEVSCNYFFYTVGNTLGIDRLSATAAQFGLGQASGIELYEETGILASREYKESHSDESWFGGDTLQASIGQSLNLFTPLQIASYAATIASGGTRYAAHLLKSVRSYDGSELLYSAQPEVLSQVDAEQLYFDTVKYGMLRAAQNGSVSSLFANYPVNVAAKTGTVQLGENTTNNGVFICFAPYEDPEIAIAVVVEKGGSGSAVAAVARDVLDCYFESTRGGSHSSSFGENELLP